MTYITILFCIFFLSVINVIINKYRSYEFPNSDGIIDIITKMLIFILPILIIIELIRLQSIEQHILK